MKNSILFSSVTLTSALLIAACGDETTTAGIGGSGYVSSGTITGFGSIFVNGVEFETTSSTFDVDDDTSLSESDLAIGMRVVVTGSVNADGITGTATSVTYDDELQGPVSALSAPDADGIKRTFTVLGKTVRINSTSTNFDISGSSTATSFDFNTIENNNHVEISGYFDSSGVLVATRVELKALDFNTASSIIELKGTITGLSNDSFGLEGFNGITIDASSASIEDLPGLSDGAYVEVKGTCDDASCTTISASRVEGEGDDFDNASNVEIEGIITRYASDSDFDIDGFPFRIDASNAQKEPTTLQLAVDMLVEVEGSIINNVLVATEVEQEDGEIKVAAIVESANLADGTFELRPVAGQPTISVQTDTSTEFEDELNDLDSAALLDNLNAGDFIVVEGVDDGSGSGLIAKSVKRESAVNDVIIQATPTAATGSAVAGGTITILGVSIAFDTAEASGGTTDFEDGNDVNMDVTQVDALISSINSVAPPLIKIKDNEASSSSANPVGTADEIDLESP